jgi:hypothetical protein
MEGTIFTRVHEDPLWVADPEDAYLRLTFDLKDGGELVCGATGEHIQIWFGLPHPPRPDNDTPIIMPEEAGEPTPVFGEISNLMRVADRETGDLFVAFVGDLAGEQSMWAMKEEVADELQRIIIANSVMMIPASECPHCTPEHNHD